MNCGDAIEMLVRAGYSVAPSGEQWHIEAPEGSRGAALQPGGAVLPESTMIALAKAVEQRFTPQFKMREVARWN